jgi:hypothetical protein
VTGGRTDISQTGDNLYSSGGGIYVRDAAENEVGTVVNCTIRDVYIASMSGSSTSIDNYIDEVLESRENN